MDCEDPGPDFEINNNTKVCSNHFTPEDFSCGGTDPHAARCVLKKTAIVIIVFLEQYHHQTHNMSLSKSKDRSTSS